MEVRKEGSNTKHRCDCKIMKAERCTTVDSPAHRSKEAAMVVSSVVLSDSRVGRCSCTVRLWCLILRLGAPSHIVPRLSIRIAW